MGTNYQGRTTKHAWEVGCGPGRGHCVKVSEHNAHQINKTYVEIVCKNVGNFENGKSWIISETFNEDTNSSVINIGDTVNFECEDGFEMDGIPVLECLEDGILSELPPICQPVPCSTPPM